MVPFFGAFFRCLYKYYNKPSAFFRCLYKSSAFFWCLLKRNGHLVPFFGAFVWCIFRCLCSVPFFGAFVWCLFRCLCSVPIFGAFVWCLCSVPLFGAFFWCLSPGSTKAPSHPVVPFLGAFDKGTGKGTKPVPFSGAFVVLVPFFWCLSQNLVQCTKPTFTSHTVLEPPQPASLCRYRGALSTRVPKSTDTDKGAQTTTG